MKKVLIYGDSNTWGDNFLTGYRIPDDKQWANILKNKLKDNYIILQEGLPGRLAGAEEEIKKYKNGKDTFVSTFRTCAPIDTLIIELGTNDLQIKYDKSSNQIISDLLWYQEVLEESFKDEEDKIKYFKDGVMPNIIYILPINFDYKVDAKEIFNEESEEKRQQIINYFSNSKYNYIHLENMSLFADGIHLNYDGHEKMAQIVEEVLENE